MHKGSNPIKTYFCNVYTQSKLGAPNQWALCFQVLIPRDGDRLLNCGFQGWRKDGKMTPFSSQLEGGKSTEPLLRQVAGGLAGR